MADADKNRVVVLAVVEGGLSVAEAAERFGLSRRWIYALLARYRAHGAAGLEPRSRAPRTSPQATSPVVRARILALRDALTSEGLDAGAESIAARLACDGLAVPATSTIWRILRDGERVTPQPRKRPRSSWRRFEAPAPNGCWQSDMTHWRLADGTEVEVVSWLDDHSRFLLHISVHDVVTAPIVTETFLTTGRRSLPRFRGHLI